MKQNSWLILFINQPHQTQFQMMFLFCHDIHFIWTSDSCTINEGGSKLTYIWHKPTLDYMNTGTKDSILVSLCDPILRQCADPFMSQQGDTRSQERESRESRRVISQELNLPSLRGKYIKAHIDLKRCSVMSFDFSFPLCDNRVIRTGAHGTPEEYHKVLWQYYKKKTKNCFVEAFQMLLLYISSLRSASDRPDDSECGQLVPPNENSCDVFENALYMTQTRRERESACFEKRVCWCSLAFLINFVLTLHPHCMSHLPKLFSKRTERFSGIARLLKELLDDTASFIWDHI